MISRTASARRRRRLGMLALSVGVLAALLAPPTEEAGAAVDVNPLKVVLIGDSYAAGNGARDADGDRNYAGPAGCYRSPTNWASQYVDWLRSQGFHVTFVNRACSGARIDHYTQRRFMDDRLVVVIESPDTPPQEIERIALSGQCRTRYPGDEVYTAKYEVFDDLVGHVVRCTRFMEPQINAIGEDTDLVLITGGGNDVNFEQIVLQCFTPFTRDPSDCREHVDEARDLLADVEANLVQTLAAIRATARPDTKVALVGYPFLANNDDFELVFRRFGIWESDRYAAAREVRELGRVADMRQQAAVDRANAAAGEAFATFVSDVKQHFSGHEPKPELGTGNPDRWMNEIEQLVLIENYHYNAEGHRQLGILLRQYETFGALGLGTDTSTNVDLAFVIDTTGSMGGDIDAVKASANAIIDRLESGTQSYRVAVIDYRDFPERTGDPDDYPSQVVLDFSSDPDAIRDAINGLTLGDGGDFAETVWSALMEAFALDWRPGVKKVALQFGDAPALNPEPVTGLTTLDVIIESFLVDPVAVYAIDTGFAGEEIRQVAEATGGEVLFAPTPDQVADRIQEVLDTALASPYAWVGTGYSAQLGSAIAFDGSGSFDPDGEIVGWEWDADGDGVFETATPGPDLVHTYPGAYSGLVVLRVTDDSGLVGLASAPVDVSLDGDSLPAEFDNCPDAHNPGQEDADGDGVGDLCDPDWELPTEDAEGVSFANGPPPSATVIGGPYKGAAGEPIAIAGDVSDPEGDIVTPTWYPTNGCIVADPGALTTTVTCDSAGTHELFLAADDGNGGTVAANTSLIVTMNGVSSEGLGLVDPATGIWYLRDGAGAQTQFYYGNPGDAPFMGDWDCNGTATPGLYRQSDGFAYLRNSNTQGIADTRFFFGNPGDIPLAGDFNNDGCDTLSIYRPSEARFYIINELGSDDAGLGAAEFSFLFGNPGDKPVVGDWDGDGIDEIGLHRESTGLFYWRNTLDTGIADGTIFFGDPGDRFVAGDWGIVDGTDTPAVFRPSNTTFFFRHTLTQGNADSQFVFGQSGWLPVAGDFGLG